MIFRNWVLQNFPFLEDDFDALTDYELFCKMVEYMKKSLDKIVEYQGKLNEFRAELDSYKNYFDNLDVQEEINNKLDEMAESGELTDIIAQYLQLAGVLAYDTLSDLENAENVANGSICMILGKDTYNDGKTAYYKIRNILNTDVIDGDNIIGIVNDNTLVGEKIPNYYLDILFSEKDKNIRLKNYYVEDSNIYIVELNNIDKVEVFSSNGSTVAPGGLDILNVRDFINANNSLDYDIFCNCAVFNPSTGSTIGYSIFDGVGYQANIYSENDFIGFDDENNLSSIAVSDTTLADLLEDYQNGFTAFHSIITDGDDVTPIDTGNASVKFCLGQLTNKDLILVVAYSRRPLNSNIDWDDLRTFIKGKYPTIYNLCVLDGGGSAQIATKDFSIIPSTSMNEYTGRNIPVILGIKVKDEGGLL